MLNISNLLSLRPFLLDNLLRVGRGKELVNHFYHFIQNIKLFYPKIIRYQNCHSGRDLTLGVIREKFWIVHAKSLIRKLLFDCHYCKHQRVLLKTLLMSELPIERFSVVKQPIAHTGVDYFGPLSVNLNKKTRANHTVAKRYGAIFTCLSSNALHI